MPDTDEGQQISSLTQNPMAIQLLAGALLSIWLLHKILLLLRSPVASADNKLRDPPLLFTPIPFIGHVLGIAFKGSNSYISSLCTAQRSTIATIRLPGQDMHLIHPLDSVSIKRFTGLQTLSLMTVFRVAVGPAMGLVPASEKFLTDLDTGISKRELSKLFNEQLRGLRSIRGYSTQLERKIDENWAESMPAGHEPVRVGLASWVFDMLSQSMGAVFWGEDGPFEDAVFREQLRIFIQNLEALRNPISFLVPRHLRSAREYVREKLDRAAENEAYGLDGQEATLFKRLAILYEARGVSRAGFTDCHLVAIVGLMSNVINVIAWALCHIAADKELIASLLAELDAVVHKSTSYSSSPDNILSKDQRLDLLLDLDQARDSCPLLLATWYELLRTYGDSPVARYVHQDSVFDAQYQVRKGSIIMTPIHLHNFKEDIWGPDVDNFRPSRFLSDDGSKIDSDLIKHLEVFGLPGMHQCPGRYLAMNLNLALVAKVLLSFDVTAVPGVALSVPNRKETMLGLPATGSDPEIFISRREGVQSVHVGFENVRPGW